MPAKYGTLSAKFPVGGVSASVKTKGGDHSAALRTVLPEWGIQTLLIFVAVVFFVGFISGAGELNGDDKRIWIWSHDHNTPAPAGYDSSLHTYAHGRSIATHAFTPGGLVFAVTIGTFILVSTGGAVACSVGAMNFFAKPTPLISLHYYTSLLEALFASTVLFFAGERDLWHLLGLFALSLVGSAGSYVREMDEEMGVRKRRPIMSILDLGLRITPWAVALIDTWFYYDEAHGHAGAYTNPLRDWYSNKQLVYIACGNTIAAIVMILRSAHSLYLTITLQGWDVSVKATPFTNLQAKYEAHDLTNKFGIAVFAACLICTSIDAGTHDNNRWFPVVYRLGNVAMNPIKNEVSEVSWVLFAMSLVGLSFYAVNLTGHILASIHDSRLYISHSALIAIFDSSLFVLLSMIAGANDIMGCVITGTIIAATILVASQLKKSDTDVKHDIMPVLLLGVAPFVFLLVRAFDGNSLFNCASHLAPNGDLENRSGPAVALTAFLFIKYVYDIVCISGLRFIDAAPKYFENASKLNFLNIAFTGSSILIMQYCNFFMSHASATAYTALV